ncbi:putative cytochrome P450 [Golovinomyces cichoracearum]|uniref:Putative cytochrome P450 n=1 Tax=Golovinomyces cichoracearum TaxID=62708 RepID=A0A420IM44_9PEZI|nr:putative cytochrome P450 [Golovinomyces cichoracearum]
MFIQIFHFSVLVILFRWFHTFKEKTKKKKEETKFDALVILRQSSLEARASPNQRLQFVFGIHNAFTSTNPNEYNTIMGPIRHKLKVIRSSGWSEPVNFIHKCLQKQMFRISQKRSLNLSSVIRKLTFRLTLYMFFSRETLNPSDQAIESITTSINSLWIDSKNLDDDSISDKIEAEKKDLLSQLGRIMNTDVEEGENNPLNIIIPAYETLWRVVLRCFLEIRFRASVEQRQNYRDTAIKFFREPHATNFKVEKNFSPSLAAIIKEALRLYPPTKRIYRLVDGETIRIEVEKIQRDPTTWGPDSTEFKPSRWQSLESNPPNYLPFGAGKFQCPAQHEVAPMMIAVLISVLINQIGNGYAISEDFDSGPLSGERDAFAGLELMVSE